MDSPFQEVELVWKASVVTHKQVMQRLTKHMKEQIDQVVATVPNVLVSESVVTVKLVKPEEIK